MRSRVNRDYSQISALFIVLLFSFILTQTGFASDVFSEKDLLKLKSVTSAKIGPNGGWIAYTVSVPRKAADKPGSGYSELYLISTKTKEVRPYITGKVRVGSVSWRPDGSAVGFLTSRGEKAKTQVWMIPISGGEAKQLTHSKTSVSSFRWHPTENKVVYLASTPKSKHEKELGKKGYGFVFYEENLKHRNLYLADLDGEGSKTGQLTNDVTVWSFEFSPDGKAIAAALTKENLIDHSYAFKTVHLLDLTSRELKPLTKNPGKLGNFSFSPNGRQLAYAAALSQKDNAVSQAFVVSINGGEPTNLTQPNFHGHVNWVNWKDNNTLFYHSDEGVETTLSTVRLTGNGVNRKVILDSKKAGVVFGSPSTTKDFKHTALVGQSPKFPGNVFYFNGKKMAKLTNVNP